MNFIGKSNVISFDNIFNNMVEISTHKTNESIVKAFNDWLLFFENNVQIETCAASKNEKANKCVQSLGHFFPQKGVNIFQYSKVIDNFDESHDSQGIEENQNNFQLWRSSWELHRVYESNVSSWNGKNHQD